jgi:hypothetical protein
MIEDLLSPEPNTPGRPSWIGLSPHRCLGPGWERCGGREEAGREADFNGPRRALFNFSRSGLRAASWSIRKPIWDKCSHSGSIRGGHSGELEARSEGASRMT